MEFDAKEIEEILSRAFGQSIRVGAATGFPPWDVARIGIHANGGGVPPSVILKKSRRGLSGSGANESAALDFINAQQVSICPRSFGFSPENEIVLLEDLEDAIPLDQIVRKHGYKASLSKVRKFALKLAQLAACTCGKKDDFLGVLGKAGVHSSNIASNEIPWEETKLALRDFSVVPNQKVEKEFLKIAGELNNPRYFAALSNGDSEFNNFLVIGEEGRIIDFEAAHFRHAICDIVCLYTPGPNWVKVANPVDDGTEHIYRTELAKAIPQISDDGLFGKGLAAACIEMTILKLNIKPGR